MPLPFAKLSWVLGLLLCLGWAVPESRAQQARKPAKTTSKPTTKPKTSSVKPKVAKDTTRLAKPTVSPLPDSLTLARRDTIKKADSVRVSNDLATTVTYTADDSIVFSAKTRIARLYGNADITYGDINLKAAEVQVNYQTSIVDAKGKPDSTGKLQGTPIFVQGSEKFQSDQMRYNFKTRKGLIQQVITQQGDGYLHGEAVKRESEKAFFVKNAEYTTCNLEHPHFYIKSYKMKMVPGQKIISGPFLLHIADVPTPLGFAFGFFPIPKYKSSGIIIPTYGESSTLGFFLRNGGFYFAVSDYFDLKLLGEVYSLGGWGLTPQSSYRKRYKYDGTVSLRYNQRSATAPDGSRIGDASREFWLNWNHTPAARGNSRFSASVNAGSNGYNQRYSMQLNNVYSTSYNSSVNYSTSFPGTPFTLSASARLDQNVTTGVAKLDLPTAALTMNRIYPFKKAGSTKSNALTNLNIAYNLTTQNSITNEIRSQTLSLPYGVVNLSAQDQQTAGAATGSTILPISGSNLPTLLKNASFGIKHSVPVATTMRVFQYFNLTPSLNYNETWYLSRLRYNYDDQRNGVTIDTVRGFNRFYDFSASASLSTQVYGTYFIKKGKWEAIRHRLTPTVGFSYRPDFGGPGFGFYQRTRVDSTGRVADLNPYINYIYGGPSAGGRSGSINFSLTNVVEAKLRKVSDSGKTTYVKKNLLENLNLSGGYNIIADSFNLSNINIGLNTRIFDKVNVATNATLDPYAYDNRPVDGSGLTRNMIRRPRYALASGQGLGKITSASISFGYNFKPPGSKKKAPTQRQLSPAEEQELSFINANPNLFVDFAIPWTLNVQYNGTYLFRTTGDKSYMFTHYAQTSGDVSISPKWKLGFNAPFDFQTKRFSSTALNIYRDLHCWEMRMNVILSNTRPMYTFDINVKASILQDLKLSKRNSFYDR